MLLGLRFSRDHLLAAPPPNTRALPRKTPPPRALLLTSVSQNPTLHFYMPYCPTRAGISPVRRSGGKNRFRMRTSMYPFAHNKNLAFMHICVSHLGVKTPEGFLEFYACFSHLPVESCDLCSLSPFHCSRFSHDVNIQVLFIRAQWVVLIVVS